MMVLPSFAELDSFVTEHPDTTVWEVVRNFNQQGNYKAYSPKGKVWAFGTTEAFAIHLKKYMQQKHVNPRIDSIMIVLTDDELYEGPERYLPVVIKLKE